MSTPASRKRNKLQVRNALFTSPRIINNIQSVSLQAYIAEGGDYFNALNDAIVMEDAPAEQATNKLPKSKLVPRFLREAELWAKGAGWRNIENLVGASLTNYNVEAIKRDTLQGKRVKALLNAQRRKGGDHVFGLESQAKAMIDRMAANFNPLSVIKLMGYVMSNVFHRLYQAVFLNEKATTLSLAYFNDLTE